MTHQPPDHIRLSQAILGIATWPAASLQREATITIQLQDDTIIQASGQTLIDALEALSAQLWATADGPQAPNI